MIQRIDLPFTSPPLSLNDRKHWRVKASIVADIRLEVNVLARRYKLKPVERATVTLHYRPRDKRRRDALNIAATLKPCTDGLVDAGVLARGDDSRWVREIPQIEPHEPGMPGALWLTIQEEA